MKVNKGNKHIALYYYIQDGVQKVYLGEMSLLKAACKAQQLAKKYLQQNNEKRETEFVVASPDSNITTTIIAIRANGRGSIGYINY